MVDDTGAVLRKHVPQVKGQITLRKAQSPYLGSVRFFKHLIISVVTIMMIVPWTMIGYVLGRAEANHTEARYLEAQLVRTVDELQSMLYEYEALANRISQSDAERSQLVDQLRVAETLYEFEAAFSHLHPEMRVAGPVSYEDSSRVIYLTFDDGPSRHTITALDILKRYDIKATFFVVGSAIDGREDTIRRIVEEGHTIGMHSYSHVYRDIYGSVEAFFDDFARVSDRIEELTGVKPDIYRFPGGSVNSFNERWGNTIISEMLSRGYRYYDWNVGSGDSSLDATTSTIYDAVIRQVYGNSYGIVLMHDGGGNREPTMSALPMIIDRLLREGYKFDRLTNQVRPTVFNNDRYSRG